MSEPLSIAVAVVGLIKATYSVSDTLVAFTAGFRSAPKAVHDALNELIAIRTVLRQLESYINRATTAPPSRTDLLTLEGIVATFTDCVCAVSELEYILNKVIIKGVGTVGRLKWMWHEDAMNKITLRIERQKNSMALMFSVLTCKSQQEAGEASSRLENLVRQLLAENPDLGARLQTTDHAKTIAETSSISARDDLTIIPSSAGREAARDDEITFSLPDNGNLDSTQSVSFTLDVEVSLQASWVYRRARHSIPRSSMVNDRQSVGWSFLSGRSLSEVSNISVVTLPISIDEINNGQHYTTTSSRSSTGIKINVWSITKPRRLIPREAFKDDGSLGLSVPLCASCHESVQDILQTETKLHFRRAYLMGENEFFLQILLDLKICTACRRTFKLSFDPGDISSKLGSLCAVCYEVIEEMSSNETKLFSEHGDPIRGAYILAELQSRWSICPACREILGIDSLYELEMSVTSWDITCNATRKRPELGPILAYKEAYDKLRTHLALAKPVEHCIKARTPESITYPLPGESFPENVDTLQSRRKLPKAAGQIPRNGGRITTRSVYPRRTVGRTQSDP